MPDRPALRELETSELFARRHIGPSAAAQRQMLSTLGFSSLAELVEAAVPDSIRVQKGLELPPARSEAEVGAALRMFAGRNNPKVPMIGLGYFGTITPPVIRRNILENPAWYTAYTPYQPEISQGRLEALLNFQTMVGDLTGLPTANASLLDEATAAAEALMLTRRASRSNPSTRFLVDKDCPPQTIAVVQTRARSLGIDVAVIDVYSDLPDDDFVAVLLSYPGASGRLADPRGVIDAAHAAGAMAVVAADLLALTLLEAPGTMGADVVVGTTQRFGVPLFYGGPHAGYIAVRAGLERHLPGRLVGVSVDAEGQPAYRLALQTREQHIRRDKATSNICTAQVLLAVAASMYAVYHGPEGLKSIAMRVSRYAKLLAQALRAGGVAVENDDYFDTLSIRAPGAAERLRKRAGERGLHILADGADRVGISLSEVTTRAHLEAILDTFGLAAADLDALDANSPEAVPADLRRTTPFLTHPVFTTHHSETELLRYITRLAHRDYALDRGMIPLGSCTMKLNATTEMEPLALPGFADLHPFAPATDAAGYLELIDSLESQLASITGYAKVSVQPNAGSQGEFAGLLAIRAYHQARGEGQRNVCLIPSSAHGTNAASAVLAGMRVVVVKAAADGSVDLADLRAQCETHAADLAAIMITYPSTHGAFESTVDELCATVHRYGGQVYVDGANLNALLGLAKPGEFGGDVSHLNLHKTFCIPHGGGGPGVGPVAVAAHLAAYMPTHPLHPLGSQRDGVGPVSAAPFGSAGILPISWAYIALMGPDGLISATEAAILSANYIAAQLAEHYPVLFRGHGGLVAHECILDLRPLTRATGVTVDDVAKRLIDYGFHAPTMSFPVAGTLMVEPTESESLAEIDRFCTAMISIRCEIAAIENGSTALAESPLRNAPHTAQQLAGPWERGYSRELGAFPAGVRPDKYWPPVTRIDQAYGDRNLVCSCPPVSAYSD
jgi:glycine cleavage system P protein (glycine dehydrogenase)